MTLAPASSRRFLIGDGRKQVMPAGQNVIRAVNCIWRGCQYELAPPVTPG